MGAVISLKAPRLRMYLLGFHRQTAPSEREQDGPDSLPDGFPRIPEGGQTLESVL